jgi:hypothetical protein
MADVIYRMTFPAFAYIKSRNALLLMPLLLGTAMSAHAGILATGTFTDTQPVAGTYEYNITVNNTGTTTIGTFWFAWIVGAGFMSATPTSVQSPTGWTEIPTNGGKAIQWKTSTSLLAPGDSLSGFMFDSTLSPTDLESPFAGPGLGAGDTVATSFVYIAAPLADPGYQFVVTAGAPEPSTMLLAALGIGLAAYRKLGKPLRSRRSQVLDI